MRLKDICNVTINDPNADFWLIRIGDEKTVGTPTKTFSEENIGIKVTDTERVYPDFLYYYFQYLHMNGIFENMSKGTLKLKHITTDDIKNIPIKFS